jgi:gamma-glutamyl-gamma-aminobutyraldehyde dehydrogenase
MTTQAEINALRLSHIAPQSLFIDGKHVAGTAEPLTVSSPIDGTWLTTIANATVAEIARAVAAARTAFNDGRWSRLAPAQRKKVMFAIADAIEADALALSVLGIRDNGTEFAMAYKAEAGSAAATFRYYGEALDKVPGEIAPTADNVLGLVHHEPVGVVGAIVPWNFPLMIGAWKLVPALACGNSVVLKPAETASLALLRLAEIAVGAGLPAGVLNVVTGDGRIAGDALARSMDVDVLVFTGSGATGHKLLIASAQSNLKRVYLELGGKSPNVVFADAPDLDVAAKISAAGIFRNSGQVCVAGSRLIVERPIHDDFVAALKSQAEALIIGDPLDLQTQIGAVNSEQQLAANLSLTQAAITQGADCITGGQRILQETGGTYMAPTILTNVSPTNSVFQQEVFGPVLAVTPFDTEDEAIAMANNTDLGLAGAAWTANLSRAHRMIREIRAGVVHINTYGGADNTVPLGGHKQSGNGADKSLHALGKYTNLKTAWIQL